MRHHKLTYHLIILIVAVFYSSIAASQELQVKINLNTQQVERTDKSIFENLQQTLEQWMNDRQWTELQFQKHERIVVNFNLTVTKYDASNNLFECTAMIQPSDRMRQATSSRSRRLHGDTLRRTEF